MKLKVLGSGAGGGLPQWNCGCANCVAVRGGRPGLARRTQDSILVHGADGVFLVNASPDILEHARVHAELHPTGRRATPILGIVLTNGDLDHVIGLLSLRESSPLTIYASPSVRDGLVSHNAMMRTFQRFPGQLRWRDLSPDCAVALEDCDAALVMTPFTISGKLPIHLTGVLEASSGDNIGLSFRAGSRHVVYASAAASLETLVPRLDGVDALLMDGTFWSSDELIGLELGSARAEDMAHLPISGPQGTLAQLADLRVGRKIFTHINNTNPILVEGSPERRTVEAAGWEVAYDGMEIQV